MAIVYRSKAGSGSFLLALASQAIAAPSAADIGECGELGVMDWDLSTLPAGTDSTKLRKCREHPAAFSLKERTDVLTKRSCVSKPGRGCSEVRCWGNCGKVSGGHKWCWLAWTGGRGDWAKCKTTSDCTNANGMKYAVCSIGNCKECGCSC